MVTKGILADTWADVPTSISHMLIWNFDRLVIGPRRNSPSPRRHVGDVIGVASLSVV